jgi:hypothetical protein
MYRGVEVLLCHSWTQHQMEVSGQIHNLAALTLGKECTAQITLMETTFIFILYAAEHDISMNICQYVSDISYCIFLLCKDIQ